MLKIYDLKQFLLSCMELPIGTEDHWTTFGVLLVISNPATEVFGLVQTFSLLLCNQILDQELHRLVAVS